MMRKVDHVSFTVSDLDRSIEFYTTLLGTEPLSVGEEDSEHAARVIGYPRVDLRYAWFALPGSETTFELFQYREPAGTAAKLENYQVGNGHLGLVVDDLDAEYARLTEAGATWSHTEPIEIFEGSWKGAKTIYMYDPDGITVELIQTPPSNASRFS